MTDLDFALRQLLKSRSFTATAFFLLAIGIGSTTLAFSLVNTVLRHPLPVDQAERMVALGEFIDTQGANGMSSISYVNFTDWRRENRTLSHPALYDGIGYTLTDGTVAEHVDGAVATAGFFEAFATVPELGRTFAITEESPASPRVALLSHELWMQRYHGSAAVLGQVIRLNGFPYTIIGVMPDKFRYPENALLWTPIRSELADSLRTVRSYRGVARLRPGVTIAQARLDLEGVAANLARAHPATNAHAGVHLEPFIESITGNYGPLALLLFGAVACLLLITCVNLAGLLLARGAAREREMAVRAALGASRARLIRQLLVENLLLGLIGGALGVLLASWGLEVVNRAISTEVPYWMNFTLDGPVLAFGLGISIVVSVGFGFAPAWHLSQQRLHDTLKQGGRSGAAARAGTMRALVGVQLALALVLLSGAGLLVKSFLRLQAVRPGYEASGLLTFALALPESTYPDATSQIAAGNRIVERLQALPGVEAAALVSNLPLGGSNWGRGFTLAGKPPAEPGRAPIALNRVVSADYFRTMRIALKRGRTFNDRDTATSPRVAIVDETFVQQYFPNENPIGQRIHYGRTVTADQPWMEIVGVVGDVRHYNLQNTVVRPGLYVPATQNSTEYGTFFVVRTVAGTRPEALADGVRTALVSIDRNLAIDDLATMSGRVSDALWRHRMTGAIFAGFALLALFLSATGLYGVMAFATHQRTREIGVRMALGAQPGDVVRLVLGGGLRLAIFSMAAGLVLALGLAGFLSRQLYQVEPRDPVIFGGVSLLLGTIAALACLLPAWRAMRIDPVVALRSE